MEGDVVITKICCPLQSGARSDQCADAWAASSSAATAGGQQERQLMQPNGQTYTADTPQFIDGNE